MKKRDESKKLRKIIPTVLMICISFFSVNAQNWTATDIEGVSHTLQDYLDAGKTVLVDVSAHWCEYCWGWHERGIMQEIYKEFGPEGTDDVMIFFVDAGFGSSMSDLMGGSGSEGDWISGTPFPIIGPSGQGSIIKSAYGTTSYPKLYIHCPGSTVATVINTEVSLRQFVESWQGICPTGWDNGANDATLFIEDERSFCLGSTPQVTIFNQGSNEISSITIETEEGGTVVDTYTWTAASPWDNIDQFRTLDLELENLILSNDQTITARITNVNGVSDMHSPGNEEEYTYSETSSTAPSLDVQIKVYTDFYPGETSWELANSSGIVVESHSYNSGSELNDGGGVDAKKTHVHNVTLNPNECYTFSLFDSRGNGMRNLQLIGGSVSLFNEPYGYQLIDATTSAVIVSNLSSSGSDYRESAFSKLNGSFKTTSSTSINNYKKNTGFIYPNPARNHFRIDYPILDNEKYSIKVFDKLGRVILDKNNLLSNVSVSTDQWAKGLYKVVVLKNGVSIALESLMIK